MELCGECKIIFINTFLYEELIVRFHRNYVLEDFFSIWICTILHLVCGSVLHTLEEQSALLVIEQYKVLNCLFPLEFGLLTFLNLLARMFRHVNNLLYSLTMNYK